MATLMPLCAGLVGPKSENVENVLVFKAKKVLRVTPMNRLTEGLGVTLGHFWITLGSLLGYLGCMRVTLGHFGTTLGSL